ncbi:Asp-tRNA(Asn)/Glu-tRNA(Gln) amidotransferase subunit GatA [Caminibacter pacificus]|uniref:Glutamyl-tRNA(Gln) amidotransferase subunit A n=1 Tax=Caminibacter pacificus TaxID=1424653 RepID=A0AAJ4UXL2_9BACT|nr:Asp-tRNA(Asn)/Glu-tRNA(Gln) amidotransferase subunit GatA [Caminibacter pacificus]NPA88174.1 Asp-tRNA(Asn)/Glu-tRNA(Gln) amidotransferase subunit GatA [Campylobacterota bacterium]QCI28027.1 Asp-tRNA(Asn)/Glu-tRNA(Gln) amidotransferase subunit GatA [Caminibacter pacificus]ROR39785.1 aspartyl/glutamyl-tRNA(Asn/Gln) amidotransferase subunit A [Caminibacter pacificus]
MITLKEALNLPKEELKEIKKEINKKAKENKNLGGYIEQFLGVDLSEAGDGVPIAIKDNINVKDWEITCSSKILQGYVAPYNATVIEKMLSAGLSPYGRCNMDEFAMGSSTETSQYGKTLNPHNPNRVPGGSSGGSAAVVGAGLAIAALGSDTGGSIRQPAAFCGVVGMKPTYGRVSRLGLVAFSSSLDQIGPITQNVEDAAILYNIIAGHDPKDSTSAPVENKKIEINENRKLKIAVIDNYIEEADEDIKKAILDVIAQLEKEGHTIIHKTLMNSKYDVATYYVVATAEASSNLARFDGMRYGHRIEGKDLKETYKLTRAQFGEEVKRRIMLGTFVLSSGYYDAYYLKAQKVRHLIKNEFDKLFAEADLVLTPVTPTTAFEFGSKKDPLEMYLSDIYTISVNLAGVPAISLPIAKDKDNMPIGLQLIAKHFDEQTLFDGAKIVENIVKESK